MVAKFEVELLHRTRGQIDDIVEAIQNTDIRCWWQFEFDREIIRREVDDISNIYFQMGQTMGAKGKIYLAAKTDEDAVALRCKVGI